MHTQKFYRVERGERPGGARGLVLFRAPPNTIRRARAHDRARDLRSSRPQRHRLSQRTTALADRQRRLLRC